MSGAVAAPDFATEGASPALSKFTAEIAAALPGPAGLASLRRAAFERFAAAPLPSSAEEVWRYSRIDSIDLDRYEPASVDQPSDLPEELAGALEAMGECAARVIVRNGVPVSVEVDPKDGGGRRPLIGRLTQMSDVDEAKLSVYVDPDRTTADSFTELNLAFGVDPVVIDIPANVTVERPIAVLHWIDRPGVAAFPRIIVRAGENSEATVVDWVASADVDALVAPVIDLDVARAARLRHLSVQATGPQVWSLGYNVSRVEADAHLLSASVALGGDYARVRTDSKMVGRGGEANLLAVYFGDGTQTHDFRTLQDHQAPKTTSDLLFKGAVADTARSVYSGLIRVRKDAAGTAAYQTNRNLVLSDGAHADSVPNLEIEENDVKCSHASAVGPVDEDQRYYLESRGVPAEVAERLIVLGFFDEILDRTPVPGLRPLLRWAVAQKFEEAEIDG